MEYSWPARAGLAIAAGSMLLAGVVSATPAYAVAGGTVVSSSTYGFVAKVQYDGASCTGALIASQWVITARDCFLVSNQPVNGAPPHPTTAGDIDARPTRHAPRARCPGSTHPPPI